MTIFGTITSQGQLSIPVSIRKKVGFNAPGLAIITVKKGKVIIEPEKDIMSMGGVLKKKSLKGKTTQEIMRIEKEASRFKL